MEMSPRVVHLSVSDTQGGAARSAYRLHRAMLDAGMASQMCVQHRQSKDPSVVTLNARGRKGIVSRLKHLLDGRSLETVRRRQGRTLMFSLDTVSQAHGNLPNHDVLHLHWISGFIDFTDLAHMGAHSKAKVWTLHDMNPLTGGCHFPGACRKYTTGCLSCPMLESHRDHDLAWRSWGRRETFYNILSNKELCFVSPSHWLAEAAGSSPFLHGRDVRVIPYGVDLDVYRPADGAGMRSVLHIPGDTQVVLVLAARLSDLRKGGAPFFEALAQSGLLGNGKAMLLAVGRDMPAIAESLPHRFVGPVENENLLAGLYNCADLLLMPTLEDNLPNAAIESISCGVPVVSYATGGMPDIVGEQEAGVIVPRGDAAALLNAARQMLDDAGGLRQKKAAARKRAERLFSKQLQASRYKSLYQELIESNRNQS